MATPTAKPSAEPSAQPTSTDFSTVCTKSRPSVSDCASSDSTMPRRRQQNARHLEGRVTPTCQKKSTHRPNSAAVSEP